MMAVQTSTSTDPARRGQTVERLAVPRVPLTPLALALCLGAACLALAFAQADPTEAMEGRLLTLLAGGVVACAACAAQLGGGKWLPVPAAGSVLVLACLWLLHQGPQRGGAVVLVLVVTLAAGLARGWRCLAAGRWERCIAWSAALAVGVQLLVRPDLLLPASDGIFERQWQVGLLVPAVFATGLGLLAGALGRPVLLVGAAVLISKPGLDLPGMAVLGPALLLALGIAWLLRRSGRRVHWTLDARWETRLAGSLLAAGAVVVALASYPWLHPSPWAAVPALLVPPRVAAVPLERGVVVLSPEAAVWRAALPTPVAASRLVVDSSLVHGLAATDERVATVRALAADGEIVGSWNLVGGTDTADWAAERRDVRALEGFRAPPAWVHYVPPDGTFFGHRYRTRLALPAARRVAAVEVSLTAPAAGARGWELHLVRVELRR